MLHKLFSIRSARSLDSKHSRRLELEGLEDRVPPALVVGGAPAGPYVVGGSFNGQPGSSVVIIPQSSPLFDGEAADYPTYYRGFEYASDAYIVNVQGTASPANLSSSNLSQSAATGNISFAAPAAPSAGSMQLLGQMEQFVGTLSAMAVAQSGNPSQVFNLAVDEFFAAVDTVALAQAHATGINAPTIQSDLTARLAAIQNNPVANTPIGHVLGSAVFDTALYVHALYQGAGT